LLQPPHTLRYERFDSDPDRALISASELHALLCHLPSLTVLDTVLDVADEQLDFLAPLVNLTELDLHDTAARGLSAAALLLPSLLGMVRLTSLTLRRSPLTSDHLAQLLPRFSLLKQLTLEECVQVRSPHFLSASPSLSKTLTHLQLLACPIAPDLAHFSTLHALTHFVVGCKNTAMLDAAETAEWRRFISPSRFLPNLLEFEFVIILQNGERLQPFKPAPRSREAEFVADALASHSAAARQQRPIAPALLHPPAAASSSSLPSQRAESPLLELEVDSD
jgi:hypothetical protein